MAEQRQSLLQLAVLDGANVQQKVAYQMRPSQFRSPSRQLSIPLKLAQELRMSQTVAPKRRAFALNLDVREALKPTFWVECIAELLATFFFLLLLVGTVNSPAEGSLLTVQVAIAVGLFFLVLVECFGHISGANLNPAVSLGLFLNGNISIIRMFCYMIFQVIGAAAGCAFALGTLPNVPSVDTKDKRANFFAVSRVIDKMSIGQGFALEMVCSFLLMFTILSVADDKLHKLQKTISHNGSVFKPSMAIAFAIAACVCLTGTHTGASMNPARSLGPCIVSGCWYPDFWIYLTAPFAGSIFAVLLHKLNLERERLLYPAVATVEEFACSGVSTSKEQP